MRFTPQLLPSRSGNVGVLMLNNAKALNALTLDMVNFMDDVLKEWLTQKDVPKVILLKSNTKESKIASFCAGGDVKLVYTSALEELKEGKTVGQGIPGQASADFFRHEYAVNHRLATLSTSSLMCSADQSREQEDPTLISFWDGLVMGGGVGISIYGKYRIATERTVWAMPETGIGFFPDVGSLYWMPRLLPMDLALYLALTGRKLGPSDLLSTGLATHYVPSEDLPALEAALVEATVKKKDETAKETDPIAPLLMSFHREATPPQESALAQDRSEISNSFGAALKKPDCTVADVLASLPDNDFGRLTSDTLAKMSPTSCAVTLEGLKRGAASATVGEDFVNEFRLGQACLRPLPDGSMPDFFEGIRAALVDKDNKPRWQPATLDVNTYFEPVQNEWKVPSNVSKL